MRITGLLVVLITVFISVAAFSGAPEVGETEIRPADGQEIYMTRCMSCHQMNGEGVPGVFPPLAGSEFVEGDKGSIIRVILHGMSGEIVVKGVTYSGMMPPWGGFLSDADIAQVLTYVRSNFGNDADAVTEEEVARVRAATADRKATWTMEQLNLEENQGIPDGE